MTDPIIKKTLLDVFLPLAQAMLEDWEKHVKEPGLVRMSLYGLIGSLKLGEGFPVHKKKRWSVCGEAYTNEVFHIDAETSEEATLKGIAELKKKYDSENFTLEITSVIEVED